MSARGVLVKLLFGDEPFTDELLHATLKRRPATVAFDTAKFQSADSFIERANGRSDVRASGEFRRVADAFCNGADLVFPLPYGKEGIKPRLLEAWPNAKPKHNLEFDPTCYADEEPALIEAFVSAMATDRVATHTARWVCFQFTDTIGTQYKGRGADEPIQRVAPVIAQLLEQGRISGLEDAMREAEDAGDLLIPVSYELESLPSEFQDRVHYGISYAFSIFLRGWSYAEAFGTKTGDDAPEYSPLWLRNFALRSRPRYVKARSLENTVPSFPWGLVLLGALEGEHPSVKREMSRVIDIMQGIRTEGPAFLDNLSTLPTNALTSEPTSSGISEGEAELLRFLGRHGVFPQIKRFAAEALAQAAEYLPSSYGGGTVKRELVRMVLDEEVVRGWGTSIEKTFRRDVFWDGFELPRFRQAVREWHRDVAKWNRQLRELTSLASG